MNPPIQFLFGGVDVKPLVEAIHAHPELWNQYGARTKVYEHSKVSDIWVRYNDYANFDGNLSRFNDKHESVWYPAAKILPVEPLVRKVVQRILLETSHWPTDGTARRYLGEPNAGSLELGGVLITKVPAGGQVLPHIDRGWHAAYYEKFAVQLAANEEQAFCFEEAELITQPGDVYTFRNDITHWVENPSDEDRMTLIVCIKRN
jgi:hypothetical protein